MDNEKTQPFVTIYCDIVEDTDAGIDSDATIDLVTPTKQSPSITPADHCAETVEPAQSSPPHEKVSTHIFKSIQTQSTQEITRARQLHDEKLAVVELTNNKLTMRAVHAPRETLRMYLKKHIPAPIPSGDKNILNKKA
jgi:hypothetical protein